MTPHLPQESRIRIRFKIQFQHMVWAGMIMFAAFQTELRGAFRTVFLAEIIKGTEGRNFFSLLPHYIGQHIHVMAGFRQQHWREF